MEGANTWRNDGTGVFSASHREADDEEALTWAALEKLPTELRMRRGILKEDGGSSREIDIKNLGPVERKNLVERLLNDAEVDNEKFLLKLQERIQRAGLDLPTTEVRFEHLTVDADAYVGSRALPTVFNFIYNIMEVSGRITYNGHEMEEFVPQRTSAYISQQDNYVTVEEFSEAFRSFHIGRKLHDELAMPFDEEKSHTVAPM